MSEREAPLTAALRLVFGPLVKQSAKWPAPLSYALACVVALVLIAALFRSELPLNLTLLFTVIVLAPIVAFVFVDWQQRRVPPTITGNVFFSDGAPVKGAIVFVDGIDRKKETDETGWFQIAVEPRRSWTVRAQFGGEIVHQTVAGGDAVKLVLPDAMRESTDVKDRGDAVSSMVRLVEREGRVFESRQRLTTIGRSPVSVFRLDEPAVSWEHAQIILMSDGYHLRQVGAANPTLLSRRGEEWGLTPKRKSDVILHHGDRITIGGTTFTVELTLVAADAGTGYVTTEREAKEAP